MGGLGTTEIVVIAVVALILFGPSKIPEFAKQCGRALNMFKKGMKEGLEDESPETSKTPKKDESARKD